jgi:hypothetical protein
MRKAISYWAIRVCVSGSPTSSASFWLSRARESSIRRRVAALTPSGLERYSTGSPKERRATPWCLLGRKPEPQRRLNSAWASLRPVQDGVMTTNAGRFAFSLPRP